MLKEFSLRRNSALLNFTAKYCQNEKDILSSSGFEILLNTFIEHLAKRDALLLDYFLEKYSKDDLVSRIVVLMKLLVVLDVEEVKLQDDVFRDLLNEKDQLLEFVEQFYNYWRRVDRYAIIRNKKQSLGMQNVSFIEASNNFTNLVLALYRRIIESIEGKKENVYRQLSAGVNAGIVLNESTWEAPSEFEFLREVPFIESIILRPPFITYPKQYTRKGLFTEFKESPYTDMKINPDHWFCYPAKVGEYLAYVYFHREYMVHGVTLCNLFELAEVSEYVGKNPDMIYIFGAKNKKEKTVGYYYENDTLVGYANNCDEIDYFGYMKKMLLTLHNLKQINSNNLPIHGAMVNVVLKDGTESNIVIMGDSGAGKSESLEAFRKLSEKYLKNIRIVFDDMGVFKLEENQVIGYGTEIGAFVRLDDLEEGYAYNEMDRSVFMNPDKINARLVMPVASYKEIMEGYKVDMFLYANNYEEKEEGMKFFKDRDDAVETFKRGRRKAKGTTSEEGIVESYFANPFGVLQRKDVCDSLIVDFISTLMDNNVVVGEIFTKLGIEGSEKTGPLDAASKLFEYIRR
jgi:hypothetical protein